MLIICYASLAISLMFICLFLVRRFWKNDFLCTKKEQLGEEKIMNPWFYAFSGLVLVIVSTIGFFVENFVSSLLFIFTFLIIILCFIALKRKK